MKGGGGGREVKGGGAPPFPPLGEILCVCVCVFTVPVACLNKKVIKWPNVIRAMFGITATAWTFPVRYLVSLKCIGNARLVVTSDC